MPPAPPASVLPHPWPCWVSESVGFCPFHISLPLLRSLPRKSSWGRLWEVCRQGSRLFLLPQYLRNHFRAAQSWASPSHSPEVSGGPTYWRNAPATSSPQERQCLQDLQVLVCFGDNFGAGFSRSREVGDSHHQMGALCHSPAAAALVHVAEAASRERGRSLDPHPSPTPPGLHVREQRSGCLAPSVSLCWDTAPEVGDKCLPGPHALRSFLTPLGCTGILFYTSRMSWDPFLSAWDEL